MKYRNWYIGVSVVFQVGVWLLMAPVTFIHENILEELPVVDAEASNLHVIWRNRMETKWATFGDLDFANGDKHCAIKDYLFSVGTPPAPTLDKTERAVQLSVTPGTCVGFEIYPFRRHTIGGFIFISILINIFLIFGIWLVIKRGQWTLHKT